jgi:protein involved in polysaccharide export with SLBB domain
MLMRYFYALIGEDLNIYGSNEFNQPQDDSLLFFNTIGKNYQLAPGDTIQITITGLSPSNENYQVMNDGTITLENVYPLNVNNLNLNQVSKLVLDKILLDDASAEVFVRLNNARLVTVQISGNVKSPRTIAVPAYTPLSRVIAYSGGISDSGSLRNISLSQIGETTQTVDFYNFLQNPSSKIDPLIKNGARIFVPFKGPTVAVTGFVNNPGIYELPNDKSEISIKNLLSITGTSFLPSGAELKISYFDSSGQIATRLAVKNESLKEGEALQIGFIETRDLNISKVSGAVLKDFEIKTNTPLSIKEVIKDGAVLSLDAYTHRLH